MSENQPRAPGGAERTPLKPAASAALWAAFVCGLARAISWAFDSHSNGGDSARAALVEFCHWLAFGLYFAAWLVIATWIAGAKRPRRWKRPLFFAVLYTAYLLPVADTMPGDLTGFAARQGVLPAPLVLTLGVLLAALVPLVGATCATLLAKRLGPKFAVALAALGVLGLFANGWVLVHDYAGVHLTFALAAAGCIAPSCALLPRPRAAVALALTTLPVATWAFLGTPAPVSATIANETAAATSPTLEHLRHRVAARDRARQAPVRPDPEWFTSRRGQPPRPARPGPVAAPLVLLISIDAVRADVIHSGKFDHRLPTLADLRERGAAFSSARAPATLTKMSLSSLFRSNYYSQQYWTLRRKDLYVPSRDKTTTLPELLTDAGVTTRNVRTIAWLTNGPFFRGFKRTYLAKDPQSRYASVKFALPELVLAIDAVRERPEFLFTHLSDPHEPYARGKDGESSFERYLHELEYVDKHLAKLLAHVSKRGLTERTYVIITSDHGEEFGEHDAFTHGTTLYEAGLRVPLIIAGPGIVPREIQDNVTTLDLFPTILDLFDVPTPAKAMGESLLGVALGAPPAFTRPIVAETRLMRAWITPKNLKLIWDTRSGRVEAYDLTKDPGETQNLYGRSRAAERAFDDLEDFFAVHARTKDGYEPPYFR